MGLTEIYAAIALLQSESARVAIEADPETLKLFNDLYLNNKQAPDLALACEQDNGVSGDNDENGASILAGARAVLGDNEVNDDDNNDKNTQTTHASDVRKKGAKVHPEPPPSSRIGQRRRSTALYTRLSKILFRKS